MNVLYVTNLPSPYRVDYFNELAKLCSLTVIYERKTSFERDLAWKNEEKRLFEEIFCNLKPIGADKSIGFDLITKVKEQKFDFLIICGYASPSVMLLISYCKYKRIPFYIECDGGFNKKEHFTKRLLKKYLLNKSKGIFTTCDEMISYFCDFGYRGKIIKYPFSSLRKNEIYEKPSDKIEKNSLKKELNITENKVVISVGRFSYLNGYGKGYDVVIRAAEYLNDLSIGWYIIGGEPTEEFLNIVKEKNLTNIHFVDFKKKNELKKYYRCADVSVLMTISDVWGLVINESMACGLPVITTDKCIAGLEMIENGQNGYIVSVGDYKKLAEKVDCLVFNEEEARQISQNNIDKSAEWTIEKMAQVHFEAFEMLLNKV